MVYSITAEDSFNAMDDFFKQIEDTCGGTDIPIALCGNKVDLAAERKVTTEQGEELAQKWRNTDRKHVGEVLFMETSAMVRPLTCSYAANHRFVPDPTLSAEQHRRC